MDHDSVERNNLARKMPEKVAELDRQLTDYLEAVNAQMPTTNSIFDPSKVTNAFPGGRRCGKK